MKRLTLSVALVLAVLLGACAQPAPVEEEEGVATVVEEEESPAAEEEESAGGGELSIVWGGDEPKFLDAHADPFDTAAVVSEWTGGTLVAVGPDSEFYPYLATSWDSSEDGTTWTFELREDVVFQDGTPFNAEAVKYNFDRILDPDAESGQAATMLGPVVETEVVDEYTFRVTHEQPHAAFLTMLSEGFIAMWSPTAAEEYGYDEFQQHLVGAGPFILDEWEPGERYTFVPNPDYNWAPEFFEHQGPPRVDKVTLRWVKEESTQIAIWESGEANLMVQFPPDGLPQVREDPNVSVIEEPLTGSPRVFHFQTENPPTDDKQVRKAMQYAINHQEIVDVVYRGGALPTECIMYPGSPCYWSECESMYPHDPARGVEILAEAGWEDTDGDGFADKDGETLEIDMVTAFSEELGPMVQAQLAEIGVKANVDLVPGPIQLERAQTGDWNTMYLHMGYADPGVLHMLWHSDNLKPGGWSWTRYKDSELDELLDKGQTTTDPDERCEYFVEAQQIIMEEALGLPLAGVLRIAVHPDSVQGFRFGSRPNVDVWIYDVVVEE